MALFSKRYHPPGTPPGTLAPATDQAPPRIRRIDYSASQIDVKEALCLDDCTPSPNAESIRWVHLQGTPDVATLSHLGRVFGLHPLALEDVANSGQRPKFDAFDEHLFIILSLPELIDGHVRTRQISLFLAPRLVLSFCEGEQDPFEGLVRNLQLRSGKIRSLGADYLLYALMDTVIDQPFPLLEEFGMRLEQLEESLLEYPNEATLAEIHGVKRDLILLRRLLWPQREVVNRVQRDGEDLITDNTRLYLRDCYDHTVQVMDLLESYREMNAALLDIYLSSQGNRMNEVMRVLTVIATLFIPLTFIVGLYGMNFDTRVSPWNMPELGWRYGYVAVWGLMIAMVVGMLAYFRRKNWI